MRARKKPTTTSSLKESRGKGMGRMPIKGGCGWNRGGPGRGHGGRGQGHNACGHGGSIKSRGKIGQ
eukprot:12841586-Ditylum_brightwellii.AAC.1